MTPFPAAPTVVPDARARRQYELDWLRLLAVACVVLMHLAQTYARPTDPAAMWSVQSTTLAHVLALTGYWRMPILFLVAGMVATHTRGQRALGAYVRTRAERLLLPLLLGLLVLGPAQFTLDGFLSGASGLRFDWGYFWFLGALVVITIVTLPLGAVLARPAVQARVAGVAHRWQSLVLLAALPLAATLLPYRLLGTRPVLGLVDLKTLLGYGGDFAAGMVLASAPAFRETVMRARGAALAVWAAAAVVQVAAARAGWDAHVPVIAVGVASWAWVLTCYGFAASYLATPSPVIVRWASRALAIYILHGVALAAARDIVLPPSLPLALEVPLLAALTVGGTLALVRLSEGSRAATRVLGLRYTPLTPALAPSRQAVIARLAAWQAMARR